MSLKNRIINFENWISSGCKKEFPKEYQRELGKLFNENKEAYNYYRNWLWLYLLTEEERKELAEFYSILNQNSKLNDHLILVNFFLLNESSEIFYSKRKNSFETSLLNANLQLNQASCFQYQQEYENEIILKILASFTHFNKKKQIEVEHNKFRDRIGNLKKGVMVNYLNQKLKPYENISRLFRKAYNPKLRNTIGHNNYKIENGRLMSLDGTIQVDSIEFFHSLISIEKLNNYLLNYFSNQAIETSLISRAGVLSIAFGFLDDNPVLNIFQLSCFYNLSDHNWINLIKFNIHKNELRTDINAESQLIGSLTKELENNWFTEIIKKDKIIVIITPIVPRDKQENFITIDIGQFVLNNEEKKLLINYEIRKNKT